MVPANEIDISLLTTWARKGAEFYYQTPTFNPVWGTANPQNLHMMTDLGPRREYNLLSFLPFSVTSLLSSHHEQLDNPWLSWH